MVCVGDVCLLFSATKENDCVENTAKVNAVTNTTNEVEARPNEILKSSTDLARFLAIVRFESSRSKSTAPSGINRYAWIAQNVMEKKFPEKNDNQIPRLSQTVNQEEET